MNKKQNLFFFFLYNFLHFQRDTQKVWMTNYITEFNKSSSGMIIDTENDTILEEMLDILALFTKISHTFWGVWGIIQAK